MNIRRSIHNFRLLAAALGAKDNQLAQLVDSSNAVFKAFANQDADLRQSLQLLPGTLSDDQHGARQGRPLANVLGPTLGALRPGARALGPVAAADAAVPARDDAGHPRTSCGPFARDALPIDQAAAPGRARPRGHHAEPRRRRFKVVNYLLNELAYNPPGKEEGYLFWTAWANHVGNAVFSDARTRTARSAAAWSWPPARRSACSTRSARPNPQLGTLATLLNAPATSSVCPRSSQAGAAPTRARHHAAPATPTVPTIPPLPVRSGGTR